MTCGGRAGEYGEGGGADMTVTSELVSSHEVAIVGEGTR
jgi:hypothetical protein